MRKTANTLIILAVAGLLGLYQHFRQPDARAPTPVTATQGKSETRLLAGAENDYAQAAEQIRRSQNNPDAKFWTTVQGEVVKLLKDDREGSMHQRFLVKIAPGITLLVAHNIDLAPRVPVQTGNTVTLHGEYVWNKRGGVVHWTHHDPRGRQSGWIEYAGQRYE